MNPSLASLNLDQLTEVSIPINEWLYSHENEGELHIF